MHRHLVRRSTVGIQGVGVVAAPAVRAARTSTPPGTSSTVWKNVFGGTLEPGALGNGVPSGRGRPGCTSSTVPSGRRQVDQPARRHVEVDHVLDPKQQPPALVAVGHARVGVDLGGMSEADERERGCEGGSLRAGG